MLRRFARTSFAFLVLTIATRAFAQTDAAATEPSPPPAYQALVEEGLAESTLEHWVEARAIFRRAHAMYPNARTLRAIGMTSYELRDYPEAYRALRAALEETRRPLTDAQRAEVQGLLDRTTGLLGRYTVDAFPSDAVVRVDGVEVTLDATRELVLPAGSHRVDVRWEGGRATGSWTVQGGEQQPLPVTRVDDSVSHTNPDPADAIHIVDVDEAPSRTHRAIGFSLVGGGGAMAVVGAILLGVGHHDVATVNGSRVGTNWSTVSDAYARGPAFERAGVALLGVGAVAAAVGIPIATRHHHERRAVTTTVGASRVTVEVTW